MLFRSSEPKNTQIPGGANRATLDFSSGLRGQCDRSLEICKRFFARFRKRKTGSAGIPNAETQRGKPQPKPEIAAKNAKNNKDFNHRWTRIDTDKRQENKRHCGFAHTQKSCTKLRDFHR